MRRAVILFVGLATSCGPKLIDEPIEAPSISAPVDIAPPKAASAPPGALYREDVNATVEEGLGYFLQRVSVEAQVEDGRFEGFRIVDLEPPDFWQSVDLRPGDVVLQVNGMPIERDIDAYQAFEALKSAPALKVSYVRSGVRHELAYAIVDRVPKPAAEKPAAAPMKAPAPAPAATPKPAGSG
ncbi:MAG TPA: hypothetical protein VH142_10895 [Polyangiaceae bacterium]|nr:hypothetical protein [Polyangiaceae bacterium]